MNTKLVAKTKQETTKQQNKTRQIPLQSSWVNFPCLGCKGGDSNHLMVPVDNSTEHTEIMPNHDHGNAMPTALMLWNYCRNLFDGIRPAGLAVKGFDASFLGRTE